MSPNKALMYFFLVPILYLLIGSFLGGIYETAEPVKNKSIKEKVDNFWIVVWFWPILLPKDLGKFTVYIFNKSFSNREKMNERD